MKAVQISKPGGNFEVVELPIQCGSDDGEVDYFPAQVVGGAKLKMSKLTWTQFLSSLRSESVSVRPDPEEKR